VERLLRHVTEVCSRPRVRLCQELGFDRRTQPALADNLCYVMSELVPAATRLHAYLASPRFALPTLPLHRALPCPHTRAHAQLVAVAK